MARVTVLGAGIAGLSAARHAADAGYETALFEKRIRSGGLLDHFTVKGFRFDTGVHFGFSKNDAYQKVIDQTERYTHRPEAYNYEGGRWIKHPVQNNLYPLPVKEKVEAIKSFLERPPLQEGADYRQWLQGQFGRVIAERFPGRYTRKYWTVAPEMLSTDWVGNRLYRPSLEEVLFGAMTDETPQTYYLRELYYPKRGGFRAFLEPLEQNLDLRVGKEAVRIDSGRKTVYFRDGSCEHYELLVSSVPLPELINMLEGVPAAVKEAAESLWATEMTIVSVGLKREDAGPHLWFYIYDEEILPARVHAPYLKSPDNVPDGCSSLQFEVYSSRRKPLAIEKEKLCGHVAGVLEKMGLASRKDILFTDCRSVDYANVVFDRGMVARRDLALEHVRERGILPVGRFGEWDYLWTDQCYLSGARVLDALAVL